MSGCTQLSADNSLEDAASLTTKWENFKSSPRSIIISFQGHLLCFVHHWNREENYKSLPASRFEATLSPVVRFLGAEGKRSLWVWIQLHTTSGPRLAPGAAQYDQVQTQAFSSHMNYMYLPCSLHILQVSHKVSCTSAGETSSFSCKTCPSEKHVKGISGSRPKETAVRTTVNFQKFRSDQRLKGLSIAQSIFAYCSASIITLLVLLQADTASCQEKE